MSVFPKAIPYQGAFASLDRYRTARTASVYIELYYRYLAAVATVLASMQVYKRFLAEFVLVVKRSLFTF